VIVEIPYIAMALFVIHEGVILKLEKLAHPIHTHHFAWQPVGHVTGLGTWALHFAGSVFLMEMLMELLLISVNYNVTNKPGKIIIFKKKLFKLLVKRVKTRV